MIAFITPVPTTTPTPINIPTLTPKPTIPTSTPAATLIPTVLPDPEDVFVLPQMPAIEAVISDKRQIDRTCVEFVPERFVRDRVGDTVWPTPILYPRSHFMLDSVLVVEENMAINPEFPYGYDGGIENSLHLHVGLDVMREEGVPLLAPADGTIIFARSDKDELHGLRCDWYGQFITILHDERWRGLPVYTLYGHILNINVQEGQEVKQGDQVAEIGYGGAAHVAHLHIETRVGENTLESTRNPWLWYKPPQGHGVLAGRLLDREGKPWLGIPVYAVPAGYNLDASPTPTTWTYLGDTVGLARPDDAYAENFVIGDMQAGEYTIMANPEGEWLSQTIWVIDQRVVTVEIRTE